VSGGPIIPGLNEFDRPKRGFPRWAGFLIAVILGAGVLVGVWGFTAGGGPLSSLGQVSEELQPSGFRPTVDPDVFQVSVTSPQSGICPDQSVAVTTLESASEVVVAVSVTGPRNSSCQQGANSDSIWVDVVLKEALDDRPIIRSIDGEKLLRIR